MNKNKLVLEIVKDLRELANSIDEFLQVMEGNRSAEAQVASAEATPYKSELITLEKVRAVLAAKSQGGKQPEVKALIVKHGANKLTDLDPSCYEELLKEAEEL